MHLRSSRPRLRVLAALSATVVALSVGVLPVQTAQAEDNGVSLTPLMGWSTWNYIGRDPTAANV